MAEKWQSDRRMGPHGSEGPATRGISDIVALALVMLDLNVVRRSTIRAFCPSEARHRETGEPIKSGISNRFGRALWRFEKVGYLSRDGDFIRIHDRKGLRNWINQGEDLTEDRAAFMRSVEQLVDQINADLASGAKVSGWDTDTARRHAEVRRQELIALQRLMQSAPGSTNTGRGTVRIVPRGRSL